jgi:hypothetical protein
MIAKHQKGRFNGQQCNVEGLDEIEFAETKSGMNDIRVLAISRSSSRHRTRMHSNIPKQQN